MFCKIVCIPGYRSVKGGLIFLYQQRISVLLQYVMNVIFFFKFTGFYTKNKVYTKLNSCVVPGSLNLPNGTVLLLFLQYLGHSG